MNVLGYLYVGIADVLSILFGYMVFNDLSLQLSQRSDKPFRMAHFSGILTLTLMAFAVSISVITVAFMPMGIVITIFSIITLVWSSFAYFLMGRFYPKAERPYIFLKLPKLVPLVSLCFLAFSAT
jgi:VanZ family protein